MSTKYDFDKIIDRHGTGALAVDVLNELYGRADLTPMWVADMNFETPEFITEALRSRLDHSLYGYTDMPAEFWPTVTKWIADHHQWNVKADWMRFIPGIVKGIGFVINVFCKPDEKVIIQPPVYHPFRLTPLGNKREVVMNPLIMHEDGSYSMDFDGLAKVADEKCRVLILANPHNPAGIVWDVDTLSRLADFCSERGIIVISDEIHCDMAHPGHKHHPFASVSEVCKNNSITCISASKTFNLAGLQSAAVIIPDERIRQIMNRGLNSDEVAEPNVFAMAGTIAAYTKGDAWLTALREYLFKNRKIVEEFLKKELPQLVMTPQEATYLLWIYVGNVAEDSGKLCDFIRKETGLYMSKGEGFRGNGRLFVRLNIACPKERLLDGLARLKKGVELYLQQSGNRQ